MMSLLVPLSLSLAAAIPPAIPPPDPERIAVAIELWNVRPLARSERNAAFGAATASLAGEFLVRAGVPYSLNYPNIQLALTRRLRERVAPVRKSLDASAIRCMATGLASRLTVEQLADVRAFFATASGGAFWDYYANWGLVDCFKAQIEPIVVPFLEADVREARRGR